MNSTVAADQLNSPDTDAATVIGQTRSAIGLGNFAAALLALQRAVSVNPALLDDHVFLQQIDDLYRMAGQHAPEFLHPHQEPPLLPFLANLAPQGWVAISAGYDTNINSASNLLSVSVPSINLTIPINNPLFIQKRSAFSGLSGGVNLRYALSPQTRALFYGHLQSRYHFAENAYIPHNYYGTAAFQHSVQAAEFTASIGHMRQLVALHNLFESNNLTAQASYYIRPNTPLTLAAELKKSRYPAFSPATISGKILRLEGRSLETGLLIGFITGQEDSGGNAIELDKSVAGVMGAWNIAVGENRLNLYLASTQTNYASFSPAFLTRRRDRNLTTVAEYRYKLNGQWKDWYVTPRLIDECNDSNIALSAYSRRQLMLELLREF